MIDTRNQYDGAFTRIELLTVVAVIGLLALTQLAGFARHGEISKAAICLNNLSQLQRAWQLYADDHNGRIVAAQQNAVNDSPVWTVWNYDLGVEHYNRAQILKATPLWLYTTRNPDLWRCPADPNTVRIPRASSPPQPSLGSYSMNSWVNGNAWGNSGPGWWVYRKLEDMNDPGPAKTFVLLEEHPRTINDSVIVVDMIGFPSTPRNFKIVDYPAVSHSQGAGISFADGHVELKRWTDSRTMIKYNSSELIGLNIASPHNLDVLWLQERTTRR